MRERSSTSAIVIGAGIAGLVTARVLADHFDRVTILERDRLPGDPVVRRGVPQGRHAHVLLAAGQRLLDSWFPDISEELRAAGAVPIDAGELVWHQAGGYRVRSGLGFLSLSASRPLLEGTIRGRLLRQCPSVSVADQTAVDRLVLEDGRVAGVLVDGAEHRADLVAACTGRNTRFLDQLATAGFPVPEASAVGIDIDCGTLAVRRRPGDLDGSLAIVVEDPARGHRIGMLVPAEGDRWIVTLGSFHGDVPTTEADAYEDFARSLPSPVIADILARAEALSPVLTHRMPTSQRRHVERLDRTPAGFVVLGDAICSLNPVYVQGMTAAALQAQALDQAIARHGPASPALPRAFYRRAAKVIDAPWKIAAWIDFGDPRTTGSRPAGTGVVNRYLDKVFLACNASVPVADQTLRVQNLLARPESLVTPAMALRVLLAARPGS